MIYSLLTLLLASTLALSRPTSSVGALYTMTNDPTGNYVVINAIRHDGSITYAGVVPTGGTGVHGAMIDGGPIVPDPLFSQASIQVVDNHLFLVNPGSHSISMFHINPSNPVDIKMIGKPVDSVGEFPVSLAITKKSGNVCVLNGGKVNGVQCYKADSTHGLKPHGKFHGFGLNLTTPAAGPNATVSQVLFSADETKLRASVKGFTASNRGFVVTWDVAHDGSLSPTYTKIVPPAEDGVYPFGMTNIVGSPTGVLMTDPAFGMTVYNFSQRKTTYTPLVIEGQLSTCWVDYAKTTDSYWLSDRAGDSIYEVEVNSKSLKPTLLNTFKLAEKNGPIEIVVGSISGKDYLYALSPEVSSMNVLALKKGNSKLIQTYEFGSKIKGANLTPINLAGAAVYTV